MKATSIFDVSHSTLNRILKKGKMHPYKYTNSGIVGDHIIDGNLNDENYLALF